MSQQTSTAVQPTALGDRGLVKLSEHQTSTAAAILARSFVDDPMFDLIFPQWDTRLQALTAFFRPFVIDGLRRGEVWLAPADQGACVWYPSDVPLFCDAFEAVIDEAIATTTHFDGPAAAARLEHLVNQVSAYEPTVLRYEILWIGLVPEARGQGLGGQLLQPAIAAADAQQVGSYLVSSNHRNLSFYQRHGFQKTATIAISPTYAMTGMGRRLDQSSLAA